MGGWGQRRTPDPRPVAELALLAIDQLQALTAAVETMAAHPSTGNTRTVIELAAKTREWLTYRDRRPR